MARSWGCDRVSAEDRMIRAGLRAGASALAVCTMFLSSAAWAQDEAAPATETAAEDESEIIVTGIRESLRNAQNIKRDAETVVDAITAQDIGALPDRSVTEALQRIPGVSINRFAGSNDPDHFSVEGSGVVVRGLSFVRSEFNGRDTFSTGVYGQAINFQDVPSELLGSVEVYKNLTAEMIEGGLSGIVNLNTRLPFDQNGFRLGFNFELNYGDMAEEVTPTAASPALAEVEESEPVVAPSELASSSPHPASASHAARISGRGGVCIGAEGSAVRARVVAEGGAGTDPAPDRPVP